jgi:short-subunit dehydrogenase
LTTLTAVTGASRGIGRATVHELARRGYRVFALARTETDLAALAGEAKQKGLEVVPVGMDIADEASRLQAVTRILDATAGYGLDVIVNNAGYGLVGPVEEIPIGKLRHQLEVNFIGQLAFTQPFLPGMRERRRGRVVNISSVAGRAAAPFSGAYAASKSALEALSDALRIEVRPFGLHVVLIEPGPIRTAFSEVARSIEPPNAASPYAPYIRRFEEGREGWYVFERPPEAVARVVARVLQSHHPRPRYTVTLPAKGTTIVRRLVPDVVLDWVMARAIGG